MGLLDALRLYNSEWTETNVRKFSEEEVKAIQACLVVSSKWGRSVCFAVMGGKKYIPLEPASAAKIGDLLDPSKVEIVSLKYTGMDSTMKDKQILRVRTSEINSEEISFDNPLGL